MSATSDLLFSYLREIFFNTAGTRLDLDKLEEDYVTLGKGLIYLSQCVAEYHEFASALAGGDLSAKVPPPENEFTAPLKSLHASLKHITWQSQQVAKGDYKQRIDFMGDFADAFNTMVVQLADRQRGLENEISLSQKHARIMEQSNLLLSKLMHYIPEQIFVISTDDHDVLHTNDRARLEIERDPDYISKLMELMPEYDVPGGETYFDVTLIQFNVERYLSINIYKIEWDERNAIALVIDDVSTEKRQLVELENYAYRDALTHSFNRFYGMFALNEWVALQKRFALIFVDLDNLKFVNDKFGHNEGDEYIARVAKHLQTYSDDTVLCRIGGDEYMLLVPDAAYDDACKRMEELQEKIQNDEYQEGKDFYYSVSFGIITVDEENTLSSSEILSVADERMYEHKRARKKERSSII
ncbi:MAG: diguanylate cyclase [Oscillospiraceae bacterium]|nr:diguanylate cyclase [Oscillospiraceae bacterium]